MEAKTATALICVAALLLCSIGADSAAVARDEAEKKTNDKLAVDGKPLEASVGMGRLTHLNSGGSWWGKMKSYLSFPADVTKQEANVNGHQVTPRRGNNASRAAKAEPKLTSNVQNSKKKKKKKNNPAAVNINMKNGTSDKVATGNSTPKEWASKDKEVRHVDEKSRISRDSNRKEWSERRPPPVQHHMATEFVNTDTHLDANLVNQHRRHERGVHEVNRFAMLPIRPKQISKSSIPNRRS